MIPVNPVSGSNWDMSPVDWMPKPFGVMGTYVRNTLVWLVFLFLDCQYDFVFNPVVRSEAPAGSREGPSPPSK
jgi:hypothetical protein